MTPFRTSRLSLVLATAPALLAQTTTGAVSGRVTDAAGSSLPGARVAFESPALFRTKAIVTDARGEYHAQLLPVGTYTVRVSAPGMLGRTATNVRVGLGANLGLDFALKAVSQASATVEVTSTLVQEAKTEDKVSYNYSAEDLLRLPTDRGFEGALSLAPGVMGNGMAVSLRGSNFGNDNQRNGGGQANAVVGGGYAGSTLYHVDGIDVTDTTGVQTGAKAQATLYQPLPDSIEDVQVVLSALNARNGRANGGQVNIVTKTGSNEWSAAIRTDLYRPSWTTSYPKGVSRFWGEDASVSEAGAVEAYSRYTDLTVSGPLVKDRLWFYLGTRLQPVASGTTRLYNDYGGNDVGFGRPDLNVGDLVHYPMITMGNFPLTDAVLTNAAAYPAGYRPFDLRTDSQWQKTLPADVKYRKLEGKISGLLDKDNTLFLTFLTDRTNHGGMSGQRTSGGATIFQQFMGDLVQQTDAYTLGWNGTFRDRWFVELRLSTARFKESDVKGPTTYPTAVLSQLSTGYTDPAHLLDYWGWFNWTFTPFQVMRSAAGDAPSKRGNNSINLNIKTIQEWHGQHEIDLGGEIFETVHAFGNEVSSNAVVYNGGFIYNPADASFLFASLYTADPAENMIHPGQYGAGGGVYYPGSTAGAPMEYVLDYAPDQYPMMGPGNHLVQYWSKGKEAWNKSRALWVNDSWTVDSHWNVMAGLRWNHFAIYDTDGSRESALSILEPRLQVKWNPDGADRRLVTASVAKLASAYSDDMASAFRTNALSVYTLRGWKGLPGQNAIDSAAATSGADPTAGVAWVPYGVLTDFSNYGTPIAIADSRQTFKPSDVEVPYCIETQLGLTRNYRTGVARVTFVRRDYKKDWVSFVHGYGDAYVSLIQDPSGLGGSPYYTQNQYFLNSKFDRVYQGIETAWEERVTARLSYGGNFTLSQQSGVNNLDYYNYLNLKQALGLPQGVWAPEGIQARDRVLNAYVSYLVPVGKGSLSGSILAKYVSTGIQDLYGTTAFDVPMTGTTASGVPVNYVDNTLTWSTTSLPTWNNYLAKPGTFRYGADVYAINARLQAQIPLQGRLMLTTYVQIDNLFNRILPTGTPYNDWSMGRSTNHSNPYVPGLPITAFNGAPWGLADSHYQYTAGRTFSTFSVGLKY